MSDVSRETSKPPYSVPTMAEVRATPSNGLTVVSTFTGAGGSCLGFRLAGFRTVWASEFVDAARETYEANFPGVPVDARSIRVVSGDDVRAATGLDEFDVMEGSPPCASFSQSGRREEGWGDVRKYSDTTERVDDLFFEYARLLAELRPRAFVAENVKGLVLGKALGYYLAIRRAFEAAGYRIGARVLDAQWLGVPQHRERVIIVGFRDDVDATFSWPTPLPYRYSVRDALPELLGFRSSRGVGSGPIPTVLTHGNRKTFSEITPVDPEPYAERDPSEGIEQYAIGREAARLRPGKGSDRYSNLIVADERLPSPTVTASGGGAGTASVVHPSARRKFSMDELRRLCGFPPDFVLTGTYAQQWERLGRAVPPPMMAAVARRVAAALGV